MMEWTKQAEDMFKTWTDTQKKMWDEWIKTTQSFGKSQASDAWERTVGVWEESLKKNLHLQTEWTKLWAESFNNVKGTPKEFHELARQGQEMMARWAETQMQLWTAWFGIAKKLDPNALSGSWEKESEKVLHIWQESIKKALDAQAEWGRVWTAAQNGRKAREYEKTEV